MKKLNLKDVSQYIEPLGHKAKENNDDFIKSYSQMLNIFTKEFSNEFCKDNGEIDWEKLVRFNSAIIDPKKKKNKARTHNNVYKK